MDKPLSERVRALVTDCLYRSDEAPVTGPIPAEAVIVEGVTRRFGFHPARLESKRAEVTEILRRLPPQFRADAGGGWSFLNACVTAEGEQWGEHRDVEELLALAIGLKLARWLLQRSRWTSLPGGMPYVVFDLPEVA